MHETLYLDLDAHTQTCVLTAIDQSGERVSATEFSTSEPVLINEVTRLQGRFKYLALEGSSLAGWVAGVLRPHVTNLIVCNPFHNALISQSNRKDDFTDSYKLARLLRLGELISVYHTDEDHRVDFKIAVQQYLSFVEHHKRIKLQIKAKYHQAGIFHLTGTKVLSKRTRDLYLNELSTKGRRKIIVNLYDHLDSLEQRRKTARTAMIELGQKYPEIQQFQRIPGIGVVGAHVFSGFIQSPDRFATKQKLWRYCKLGIRERSSAGKPLAFNRLDQSGVGILKAVSYQCWLSSQCTKEANEVCLFYEASLHRTGDKLHARLNTQRKVLTVLWTIWRKDVTYNPKLFLSPNSAMIA